MDNPAFSETVPNELKELGYVPPIIKSYDKDGINVWLDKRSYPFPVWRLDVDGVQWMVYDQRHGQTKQFYSHYCLAYGHVICTGLGFGTREQWIASKPEVTKVTVLEKYKEVIQYHKDIGTKWHDKIEIINCDANEYKGDCDFLSIDHYEYDDVLRIIDSITKVYKNITCECVWFWMLEAWIKLGCIMDNTENCNIIPKKIRYGGRESGHVEHTMYVVNAELENENYIKIKKYLKMDKLPNIRGTELVKFINMYYGK